MSKYCTDQIARLKISPSVFKLRTNTIARLYFISIQFFHISEQVMYGILNTVRRQSLFGISSAHRLGEVTWTLGTYAVLIH